MKDDDLGGMNRTELMTFIVCEILCPRKESTRKDILMFQSKDF